MLSTYMAVCAVLHTMLFRIYYRPVTTPRAHIIHIFIIYMQFIYYLAWVFRRTINKTNTRVTGILGVWALNRENGVTQSNAIRVYLHNILFLYSAHTYHLSYFLVFKLYILWTVKTLCEFSVERDTNIYNCNMHNMWVLHAVIDQPSSTPTPATPLKFKLLRTRLLKSGIFDFTCRPHVIKYTWMRLKQKTQIDVNKYIFFIRKTPFFCNELVNL